MTQELFEPLRVKFFSRKASIGLILGGVWIIVTTGLFGGMALHGRLIFLVFGGFLILAPVLWPKYRVIIEGEQIFFQGVNCFGLKLGEKSVRWEEIDKVVTWNLGISGLMTGVWSRGKLFFIQWQGPEYFDFLSLLAAKIAKNKLDADTVKYTEPERIARKEKHRKWNENGFIITVVIGIVYLIFIEYFWDWSHGCLKW